MENTNKAVYERYHNTAAAETAIAGTFLCAAESEMAYSRKGRLSFAER